MTVVVEIFNTETSPNGKEAVVEIYAGDQVSVVRIHPQKRDRFVLHVAQTIRVTAGGEPTKDDGTG